MVVAIGKTEFQVAEEPQEARVAQQPPSEKILTYAELDRRSEAALDRLEGLVGPRVIADLIARPSEKPTISEKGVDLIADGEGRFVLVPGTRTLIFTGETEDEMRKNISQVLKEKAPGGQDKPFFQLLLEATEEDMLVPQRLVVKTESYQRESLTELGFDAIGSENEGFGVEEASAIKKKTPSQMAGLVKAAVARGHQELDLDTNIHNLRSWEKMSFPFGQEGTLTLYAGGSEEADRWNRETDPKKYGGKAVITLTKKDGVEERINIGSKEFLKSPLGDQLVGTLYSSFYGDNINPAKSEVSDLTGQDEQLDDVFLKYAVSGVPGEMDKDTFSRELAAMVALTGGESSLADLLINWDYGRPCVVEALNKVTTWVLPGKTPRTPVSLGKPGNRGFMVESMLYDYEPAGNGGSREATSVKFLPLAISPNLVIVEDVEPGRSTEGNIIIIKKVGQGWRPASYKPDQKLEMAKYAAGLEEA